MHTSWCCLIDWEEALLREEKMCHKLCCIGGEGWDLWLGEVQTTGDSLWWRGGHTCCFHGYPTSHSRGGESLLPTQRSFLFNRSRGSLSFSTPRIRLLSKHHLPWHWPFFFFFSFLGEDKNNVKVQMLCIYAVVNHSVILSAALHIPTLHLGNYFTLHCFIGKALWTFDKMKLLQFLNCLLQWQCLPHLPQLSCDVTE